MRKLLALIFILMNFFLITGCSNQANLNNKIQSLENENAELRSKIDQVNSLSIAYQSYEDKQRFVPKESQITALQIQGFKLLRPIEANTVIQVLDAAQCQDQQLWLYVAMPVYDTPVNFKGWIPESETVKLSKDNVKLVQGDVFLKEGTPIYEVDQFNEIKSVDSINLTHDVRGWIKKRQEFISHYNSANGVRRSI